MYEKKERAQVKSSRWGGLSGLHNAEKLNNILEALTHTTTDLISVKTRTLIQTIWLSAESGQSGEIDTAAAFLCFRRSVLLLQQRRRRTSAGKDCLTLKQAQSGISLPFFLLRHLSHPLVHAHTHTHACMQRNCGKADTRRGDAGCVANLREHVKQRNQVSLS